MIDTNSLRNAVESFSFYAKPSNGSSSEPCTVGDINKLITEISNLFNTFIDELDRHE